MAQHAAQLFRLYTKEFLVDVVGMGNSKEEALEALRGNVVAEWRRCAPDAGQRVYDAWWDAMTEGTDEGVGIRFIEFPES